MRIFVDIDLTIANTVGNDYVNSKPIYENIEKINKKFLEGHYIVYWTARGRTSQIDWHELTKKQLMEWGCKYHELDTTTKPAFDLLIDDKAINIDNL